MLKRRAILICLFLLLISTNVFAGDIPEGIMLGEQKALFIGEITSIIEDTITITPSTIMMGSITESEIEIGMFNNYYGTDKGPKVGDYIVALLLDDNKIDDEWVFRASSNDYKSLNLISERHEIVTRYEGYINEGKYFEAQKKIDEEELKLKNAKDVEEEEVLALENSKKQAYNINNKLVLGGILIILTIVFLLVFKNRSILKLTRRRQ